jgi:hypothetical protein
MRQASVLVSDDFTQTLSGKFNLFGAYTTDIRIPFEPYIGNQLVFLFLVETSPDDPFKSLELHVVLPGGDSRHQPLALEKFTPGMADQRRWSLKYPLLFASPILNTGPIEATVIHEKGTISTAAPFIVSM